MDALLKVHNKCIDGAESTVNARADRSGSDRHGVARMRVAVPDLDPVMSADRAGDFKIIPRLFRDLRQAAASGDPQLHTCSN